MMFGSRHSKLSKFFLFYKALPNNKLLQLFFLSFLLHVIGIHIQIGISLSLYAYTLQFRITKPDFPADAAV